MKNIIKETLKQLMADRYLFVLLIFLILLSIILSIVVALSIKPSELQLVSRYSAFGITHLYRDQWFYLYTFVGFELIVAVLHSILSAKLLVVKGHSFAVMFAWLGFGVIIIGWLTSMALFNIWTPLIVK